jgi:hypothetical protein
LTTFRPLSPHALADWLTELLLARASTHPLRVAVDGPFCAHPSEIASAVAGRLRGHGRESVVLAADQFWRDASVRLEFGRTDADAYFEGWLDAGALTREVLTPLVESLRYLPSLRDPVSNRSSRAGYQTVGANAVVFVCGDLLLGHGWPFDVSVHLDLSAPARARRTTVDRQWTLPAYVRYDDEVDPNAVADVVIRWDDPLRPALYQPPR